MTGERRVEGCRGVGRGEEGLRRRVEDSVGGVNTEVDLPTPGTSFMQYAHV